MTCLFIRPRHVTGRWDGARPAPRRPAPGTPTPRKAPPTAPSTGLTADRWARLESLAPQLLASARPHQNRKPHSAAHADRGFLHGWLSYAKQRPKPFTIGGVRNDLPRARKQTFV